MKTIIKINQETNDPVERALHAIAYKMASKLIREIDNEEFMQLLRNEAKQLSWYARPIAEEKQKIVEAMSKICNFLSSDTEKANKYNVILTTNYVIMLSNFLHYH